MNTVLFYKQQRVDGGIRIGIDANGVSLWHQFTPGRAKEDRALLWHVDLKFEGEHLPTDREGVRKFLHSRAPQIKQALVQCADELKADHGVAREPFVVPILDVLSGARLTIIWSSIRQVQARSVADKLLVVSRNWDRYVTCLEADPVARPGR